MKLSYIASLVFALTLFAFFLFDSNKEPEPLSFQGKVMGTSYKVILYGQEIQTSQQEINDIFENVNQEMSTYLKTSSISQINNIDLFEWYKVSKGFISVLNFAIDLCNDTKGVYDVSAGRLINKWGFGPNEAMDITLEEEKRIMNEIGCNSVEVYQESVRKLKDVHLDFSSIAKGYAIDLVHLQLLSDVSIESHYIELGGEIRTSSAKINKTPWVVGIEDPEDPNNFLIKLESNKFNNFSIATSGDYRNFRVFDQQLVSHTFNIKLGKPKKYSKSSVTVVAENAMKADALATALNAMELEEAVKYSNINNIKAIFISNQNKQTDLIFSNSLSKIVK